MGVGLHLAKNGLGYCESSQVSSLKSRKTIALAHTLTYPDTTATYSSSTPTTAVTTTDISSMHSVSSSLKQNPPYDSRKQALQFQGNA